MGKTQTVLTSTNIAQYKVMVRGRSTSTITAKQTVCNPKTKDTVDESLFKVRTGGRTLGQMSGGVGYGKVGYKRIRYTNFVYFLLKYKQTNNFLKVISSHLLFV